MTYSNVIQVLWHSAYVVIPIGFLNQVSLFLVNQSWNIYFVVELKTFVRLCFGFCDFFPPSFVFFPLPCFALMIFFVDELFCLCTCSPIFAQGAPSRQAFPRCAVSMRSQRVLRNTQPKQGRLQPPWADRGRSKLSEGEVNLSLWCLSGSPVAFLLLPAETARVRLGGRWGTKPN